MTDEAVHVRAPVVRIVDHGTTTTVIGPRATRQFDGDSAQLLRAVLDIHRRPTSRSQLLAELASRAGLTAAELPVGPIDALVALLVAEGVLVVPQPPTPRPAGRPRRVVLGISGAIAAVDAPALIRGLHNLGCDVRVALTRAASRLVSRAALEALTHQPVARSLWQGPPAAPAPHIQLAEWAELVVICPASATTLARIASGDCSDLVAAIATATRAPVVIAPSMNDAMYDAPAVQANLATLRDHGRHVVHPAFGLEVAHPPHARPSLLGPAPPASAVLDILRHLLHQLAVPKLPDTTDAWESLWSTTAPEQLPWHTSALEPPLAAALAIHHGPGRSLVDLGTGDGTVAIAAAQLGFAVTATDVAPSALGRARARAQLASAQVLLVLDDITASTLRGRFDIAVDRGVLHCLPPPCRPAYAAAVSALVSPGGSLLVIAHTDATAGTHAITADELKTLLPSFEMTRTTATTLAGAAAELHELRRQP